MSAFGKCLHTQCFPADGGRGATEDRTLLDTHALTFLPPFELGTEPRAEKNTCCAAGSRSYFMHSSLSPMWKIGKRAKYLKFEFFLCWCLFAADMFKGNRDKSSVFS